jgi:hypothetical protein
MSTHDRGDPQGAPHPAGSEPTDTDATSRWTVPGGPAVSPLPPVGPAAAYDTPPGNPRGIRRLLLPLVGILALVLVVAVLVLVFLNMQQAGAGETRAAYEYLPQDTVMAMEVRMDLPGDQRQQFVTFVSRFPGFDDAAQVERRMDEMLNEAVGTATNGLANYQDDVEPWFTGWAVVGAKGSPDMTASEPESFVAVLGSTDRGRAELGMERLRGPGSWSSQAGPGNTTIWTGQANVAGTLAYGLTDDAVVIATRPEAVRQAIETKTTGAPSVLAANGFSEALDRQPQGRLAMFWMDTQAFGQAGGPGGQDDPFGENPFAFECDAFPSPTAMAGSLYMRDGRAVMEFALQMPEGADMPQMRDSGLAGRMPRDTLLYIDVRDLGQSATTTLECLREAPMFGEQLREIEEQLGQPVDSLLSWAGDTAIGIRYDGSRVTGGLVVRMADEQRAAEAMGQVRALITAAGGQEGNVTVREEEYNGARMTTFEFAGDFDDMLEPPAPEASLSYAFHGDLMIFGMDAGFARTVIDTDVANSLSSQDAFRRSVDAAGGSNNGGVFFIDMTRSMGLVDDLTQMMMGPGGTDPQFQEMRDFMGSLEAITAVPTRAGQQVIMRLVLSTREPQQ